MPVGLQLPNPRPSYRGETPLSLVTASQERKDQRATLSILREWKVSKGGEVGSSPRSPKLRRLLHSTLQVTDLYFERDCVLHMQTLGLNFSIPLPQPIRDFFTLFDALQHGVFVPQTPRRMGKQKHKNCRDSLALALVILLVKVVPYSARSGRTVFEKKLGLFVNRTSVHTGQECFRSTPGPSMLAIHAFAKTSLAAASRV